MMRPLFLTLDEVLSLHAEQIRLFGGSPGIRDIGLLESAIGSVEATFDDVFLHETLFAMAAAYLHGICRNHPFLDGNKRTAAAAALTAGRAAERRGSRLPRPARRSRVAPARRRRSARVAPLTRCAASAAAARARRAEDRASARCLGCALMPAAPGSRSAAAARATALSTGPHAKL